MPQFERGPAPRPGPRRPAGRTLASLAAPLTRALHQVDGACMRALAAAVTPEQRAVAALEVSLWAPRRRALEAHIRETSHEGAGERIDAVLADALIVYVDEVLQWVTDVEAGGERRLARFAACCRTLVGELDALGGDSAPLRPQLAAAQAKLTGPEPALPAIEGQLVALHQDLAARLHAASPRSRGSLLDDLARPVAAAL